MLTDQRQFKRYDIYAVVEISIPGGRAGSFLGITRNFSSGGLSFESRNFDLIPGDNLEFRFKYPVRSLTAASTGEIVWKKDATKFECLTGVKFKEVNSSRTYEIMNIMSAFGNVAVDEVDTAYEVKNKLKRQWAPNQIAAENSINALMITSTNKDCSTPTNLEPVDKELNDDIIHGMQQKGIKRYYLPLMITASLLLVLALPEYYDNFNYSTEDAESVNEQSAMMQSPESEQPSSEEGIRNIDEAIGGQAVPVEVLGEKQDNNNSNEGVDSVNANSPAIDVANSSSEAYYIQVGSWKNPEYALEALDLLKGYYPEAYITIAGGFHKVKIPHIHDRTQGALIIEDIREKLHLAPLLVLHSSDSP